MTWILRNPQLAFLLFAGFVLGVVGIRSRWLSAKVDELQNKNKSLEKDVEAHETRNEVENRVAAERDPHERLRRDWRE